MRALDQTDFAIVQALREDARLPNKELASRIGLAPSSCSERVRRLMDEGVFAGFHADVVPEALGIGLQAFVAVRLGRHGREAVELFRRHALALPAVLTLFHVAGDTDFLLHVAVAGTHDLRDVLDQVTDAGNVAHVETTLIFERTRGGVSA
ncbi:MAG: Lrp/AsnC family transcriptional regulator [Bacteroidota bacterium]